MINVRSMSLLRRPAPMYVGWKVNSRARKIHSGLAREAGEESGMRLDESNEGDYRIYAGAVAGQHGEGCVATVVVNRVRGNIAKPRLAFRDEELAGGHRWPSPEAARLYALAKAREVIRTEQFRLAC